MGCVLLFAGHGHHVEFYLVGIFVQRNDSKSRALGIVTAMAFVVMLNQTQKNGALGNKRRS